MPPYRGTRWGGGRKAAGGVMSNGPGAYDPSVAVRRRHLPFAESAKGRNSYSAITCFTRAFASAALSWATSAFTSASNFATSPSTLAMTSRDTSVV